MTKLNEKLNIEVSFSEADNTYYTTILNGYDQIFKHASSKPIWASERIIKNISNKLVKLGKVTTEEEGIRLIEAIRWELETEFDKKVSEGVKGSVGYLEISEKLGHTLNPSLDFKDKAYLGLTLPFTDEDDVSEEYVLITNHREIIGTGETELKKNSIKLKAMPILEDSRWGIPDIRDYLKNKKTEGIEIRDLFLQIKELFEYYIDFQESGYYDLLTIWVIGTYFHPLFHAYPYIYLPGLVEVGKTKTVRLATLLSFNGEISTNASPSFLFRSIASRQCAIGIDEQGRGNKQRWEELNTLILGGYEQGNPVGRVEEVDVGGIKQWKRVHYSNYCPKIISGNRNLDQAGVSRSIPITMLRTKKVQGEREVMLDNPRWIEVRNRLYRYLLEGWQEVKDIYSEKERPEGIKNRDWQLWKPILTLANIVGEDIEEALLELARAVVEKKQLNIEISSLDVFVLNCVKELVENVVSEGLVKGSEGYYSLKEISSIVNRDKEGEKKITNWRIGNILTNYGFNVKRRVGKGVQYYLTKEIVEDRLNRFGMVEEECVPISEESQKQGTLLHQPTQKLNYELLKKIERFIMDAEDQLAYVNDVMVEFNWAIKEEIYECLEKLVERGDFYYPKDDVIGVVK